MDQLPDMVDEADVPIIVPPPGNILRRAARTKIRKPGLPGESAAHRFGSSRRGRRSSLEAKSTEQVSSENGESEGNTSKRLTISDDGLPSQLRDSFSEEALIFDAYARSDEEDVQRQPAAIPPVPLIPQVPEPEPSAPIPIPTDGIPRLAEPQIQPSLLEALGPILDSSPVPGTSPPRQGPATTEPSRSPSPEPVPQEIATPIPQTHIQPFQPTPPSVIAQSGQSLQQLISTTSPPVPQQPPRKEKDKDKKGLFGKWGSDKSGKKSKGSDKDKEKEKEKEKEGFFGSLFGGGKKKQEDASSTVNTAGREAAQALLGASKSSKNYVPPSSPGLPPGGINGNYARYPIHVERAIYRLSHIKLANPRRPLYEQVLISNLMFWYLGVINKAQNPQPEKPSENANGQTEEEKERAEREAKEREEKEQAEKERQERERAEREQKERESLETKKKESGKRGSLTKTPAGGSPGARRAEMPVKGPQYDIQQQVMQKEYSNGYNNHRNGGPNSMMMNGHQRNPASPQNQQFPSQSYPPGTPYPQLQQQYPNSPPRQGSPQMKSQGQEPHYGNDGQRRGGLPPGAMPPVMQQSQSSQPSPIPGSGPHSHPHTQQLANFPQQSPLQHRGSPGNSPDGKGKPNSGRTPTRSLSANATPTNIMPSMNGVLRKGNSVHAGTPNESDRRPRLSDAGRSPSEEDDVPLSLYQQQRR